MGKLSSLYPDAEAVEEALNRANQAEIDIISIKQRLDDLEYKDIKINSFSAAPPISEIGSSQTVTLAWSLNKTATNQSINGTPVTGSTIQYTGVTSNQTYTLNVADGQTSASKSVSVSFANQIYYGAAANTSSVTTLSGKTLSNVKGRTITVNAGSGQYIIYALPKRLGTVTFKVNGFDGGFSSPEEKNLTNTSGYTEVYYVYKSTNSNLGNTTVVVS